MRIHEFVNGDKPAMVLIHGMLTPWQIWMPQITAFQKTYNIYAVALSAHTEESAGEFISTAAEAEEIIQYFRERDIHSLDVLCGLSFGGKIAHEIWRDGGLVIRNLILDGAPLVSCPKVIPNMIAGNYIKIIHKSKARDKKVLEAFKKNFLPEKYLDSYLKIADFMTDRSLDNMVQEAFRGGICRTVENQSRVLFIHGTKGNEILARKAAARMKKIYPETRTLCFKGDTHCYKAIYEPEKWIQAVAAFLQNS